MNINTHNYSIDWFHNAASVGVRKDGKAKGRRLNLQRAIASMALQGHVMEFGVHRGKTLGIICARLPEQVIWGFDSFQGLPEDWIKKPNDTKIKHRAGHFAIDDQEFPVFPPNVNLIKGWFRDSLPEWCAAHPGPVSLLHIDCDLYSSTQTVLCELNQQIVPGTVIVFDEFYPWEDETDYPLWHQGEYKALGEWLETFDRSIQIICRSLHQQATIKVVS